MQPERCSSGDTGEGRGGNSSSPPESASQQLVSRPSLGSRSHWHFLKWHVKHQNFAAQRETSTLQAGEVDVLLTLGDVHFATATEAATRGDPPEVIEAEFARAEESFEAARRASLEPESASSSTTAPDSSSPSPGATIVRFKTGLAKVALARNRPADCLGHLEELPVSEPFVLQLRGEAHAAMHAYDQARDELAEAARLWRRAGDGMHEQATLQELERVRKRIEAEHVGAGRLIVFHAAPLVESDQAPAASISANDPSPPASCSLLPSRSGSVCVHGARCAPQLLLSSARSRSHLSLRRLKTCRRRCSSPTSQCSTSSPRGITHRASPWSPLTAS